MYASYYDIVTGIGFIFPSETEMSKRTVLKYWTKGSLGTLNETK